jgi:uncharacterized protein with GYD domain
MAKYIMLLNWTDQGIKSVKDSPKRLDAAREAARMTGCELQDFYMTMGAYDMVALVEAPDDTAMAKFALQVAGQGNVRPTTLKAFGETDYRSLIGAL